MRSKLAHHIVSFALASLSLEELTDLEKGGWSGVNAVCRKGRPV